MPAAVVRVFYFRFHGRCRPPVGRLADRAPRAPDAARSAADVRRHRAGRRRPRRRAHPTRPRRHALRPRRQRVRGPRSSRRSTTACGGASYQGDVSNYIQLSVAKAWELHERFDIIHSHVETLGFLFARHCPTPVVTTLHGRLDTWGVPGAAGGVRGHPARRHQRQPASLERRRPTGWRRSTTGLPLEHMPFGATPGDYLAFVGRVTAEKGVAEAIELARRRRPEAAHGGQGLRRPGEGALRGGRPAGDRRGGRRVPRRARPARARPALRRRAGDGHARRLAGAVRPRRDRVARRPGPR